jgi:hypothetical protein
MIAAVTIGAGELVVVVGMLTAVSLTFGILSRSSGWFDKKVHGVVVKDTGDIKTALDEIKVKVDKVDTLEHQQIQLAAQMNNGIKDRLDNLEESHGRNDVKLDGIAETVAGVKAMLELHLNWDGPDRRSE